MLRTELFKPVQEGRTQGGRIAIRGRELVVVDPRSF